MVQILWGVEPLGPHEVGATDCVRVYYICTVYCSVTGLDIVLDIVKPFNLAALKVGDLAGKIILAAFILAN